MLCSIFVFLPANLHFAPADTSLRHALLSRHLALTWPRSPRFAGDANDDFILELTPSTRGGKDKRKARHQLRTLRSHFRLKHALTGCYLFSHKVKLPDWGFEQQEVSGRVEGKVRSALRLE